MSNDTDTIENATQGEYRYGFITDIETDSVPPGLSEDVIRLISKKKEEPQFMLDWRLKAYKHWLTMKEPTWAQVKYPKIDYQSIVYYSAPKQKKLLLKPKMIVVCPNLLIRKIRKFVDQTNLAIISAIETFSCSPVIIFFKLKRPLSISSEPIKHTNGTPRLFA